MSAIHARIAAAKAKAAKTEKAATPQPQIPQGPQTLRPPLPQEPIGALNGWQQTRSRGRPRKAITKEHLTLPPMEQFVRHCLDANPDACEFVGSNRPAASVSESVGRLITTRIAYPRPTLMAAYVEFCKDHGFCSTIPKTFTSLVVATCLAAGWVVRPARSVEWRRGLIKGVTLRNQTPWFGNDRWMDPRPDRQRWKKKSDAA